MRPNNPNPNKGVSHWASKLTEEDVRIIRGDLRTAYRIAKDYGVDPGTIRGIKRGETWKHVKG